MKRLAFRLSGAAVALAFLTQSTGAADLAVTFARPPAAFPPPAAAFLPPQALPPAEAPAAAKPSGPSAWSRWLADARMVYAAAREDVQDLLASPEQTAPPVDAALPVNPSAPVNPDAAIASVPTSAQPSLVTPETPQDRIMIVPDPEIVGAGEALAQALAPIRPAAPTEDRVAMPWLRENGFLMRVVYLNAYGVTYGRANGFLLRQAMSDIFVPTPVPPALRRKAPIYYSGMTVPYVVELQSTDSRALSLGVFTRQEEMDGTALTHSSRLGVVVLQPGGRAVVSGTTPLLGRMTQAVNFERTHVLVTAGGSTAASEVIANEPAAGVIDPPRL